MEMKKFSCPFNVIIMPVVLFLALVEALVTSPGNNVKVNFPFHVVEAVKVLRAAFIRI